MLDPFAANNLADRHTNDLKIPVKGSPLKILIVELHFDWNGELIAAIDLGPTRQSRHKRMNPSFSSKRYQIILIQQRGTRSDETEVTDKNAPQLGQLIETCSTEKAANGT